MSYTMRSWSSDLTADGDDTKGSQGAQPRAQITGDMDCHRTEEHERTELIQGENILEPKAVSHRHFTEPARLRTFWGFREKEEMDI